MTKHTALICTIISVATLAIPWHTSRAFDYQLATLETPSPDRPAIPSHGPTGYSNPATGNYLSGSADDPLAEFTRRPLDEYIIPEGGLFMDPLHNGPHYGIDYTNPDDYLNGRPIWVYPIGPGYVTTRSSCLLCFVDGDWMGSIPSQAPQYNFGFGGMVVTETPFSPEVSIYIMYAHLARDSVSLGDYITPRESIAVAGNTGYSEEIHLHLEVRFGRPGAFWNADFSDPGTMDRWLNTDLVTPAMLIYPEYHASFVTYIEEWVAVQPVIDDSLP
ncbi:MAG: M23 family metallopeptidase [Chloroflexi bacterium]|nr:M23 family metallopeptidase [Chloroflexota bacterium]